MTSTRTACAGVVGCGRSRTHARALAQVLASALAWAAGPGVHPADDR